MAIRTISEYGYEIPDFDKIKKTSKTFRTDFWYAMNYARNEKSADDLKREAIKYIKANRKDLQIDALRKVHEFKFITLGKLSLIMNRGGELPDDFSAHLPRLIDGVYAVDAKTVEEVKVSKATSTTTIQERMVVKSKEIAGVIEGWVDDFVSGTRDKDSVKPVVDFVNLFKHAELKVPHMKLLSNSFLRIKDELKLIVDNDDDDELREYYQNFSKHELRRLLQVYENLFSAIDSITSTKTSFRKPRAKRPIDIEKLVSKLKYKKDDTVFSLTSIHPRNIPGASAVWVFNTKTKKIGCYRAMDGDGLSVKGTTIVNFSTESVEKTARNAAKVLVDFAATGKVKSRTFLSTLSTVEIKLKGRTNEDIIILRVDK